MTAKQLVIVESPTKAKTLERYLGSDFAVAASRGHVRDLPEDRMGVTPEDGFRPEYEVKPDSKEIVSRLKKAYKGSDGLWLATDFDREGEAIAWHVAESIGADPQTANRVTFTEITLAGSTSTWWTRSRPGGSSTGSSGTSFRRSFRSGFAGPCRPAGCSRWRFG